uniref:Reverse transcriptase domain-containing protein n=1 Tax=Lactuca sativa TaxID=4236 RepID=A0A9R1XH34_LACSA|nr:hypothetical protein LSAT_V11C400171510 [Lactuca sativa]
MLLDGFDEMIRASVSEFVVNQSWSKFVVLKNKLKFIKNRIREWHVQAKEIREHQTTDLKSRLHDIGTSIDSGDIIIQLCDEQKQVLGSLASIESQEMSDLVQKAKNALGLERLFTVDEIKEADWDCGGDRAPRPDGFSFQFLKYYWDILGDDVIAFVQEFFYKPIIPVGCHSSFITLIPKVKNPLLVKDFHPFSLIGMQFKIIAKILAKRLVVMLPDVISVEQSAFLKGGKFLDEPLMGLHIAIEDAIDSGNFRGVKIKEANLEISHLFYADDALFLGKWEEGNIRNLITIIRCFYMVSGLKINLFKSSLLGVGVNQSEVTSLTSITGCAATKFPFSYLGIPVGGSMSRVNSWDVIMDRFCKRLSNWKVKMLSIGMEEVQRRIHWVKWDIILNSRDNGGLEVGSLDAFKRALLVKWKWWFLHEHSSLWVRLIKGLHGEYGALAHNARSSGGMGVWKRIVDCIKKMESQDVLNSDSISIIVGDGSMARFWEDVWCGGVK